MQLTDKDGNIFGTGGLEITTSTGKPKIPVINTDITIGTTAIVGGVSGRLLFDDAGVVGETNGIFWDKVNSRFAIGTTNPIYNLEVVSSTGYAGIGIRSAQNNNAELSFQNAGYSVPRWTIRASGAANGSSGSLVFQRNAATFPMVITPGDNVLIGTSIDSGYKLNVNGSVYFQNTGTSAVTHTLLFRNENNSYGGLTIASSGLPLTIFQASGYGYLTATGFSINSTNSTIWTNNGSLLDIKNAAGNTTYVRLASTTGNFLINTTTDAGYKLDVTGTGRFSNTLTIQTTATGGSPSNSILISTNDAGNGGRISWGDSNTSILRYSNSLYFREYTGNFVFESTSANAIYFSIRPWGTTLSAGPFTTNSSITAASSIARGAYFNNTLTAAANNDVLVGLDIAPTFTNGAFTGVANYNLRTGGLITKQYFQSPTTNQGNHSISFGFGGAGEQVRLIASAAGAVGRGNLYIASATGDAAVATISDANALFTFSGNSFYKSFNIDQVSLTTGQGLYISGNQPASITNGIFFRYSETRVAILTKPHGSNGYADFRIAIVPVGGVNNPPQESDTKFMITKDTTNVLINTTTDAGYKLDVNGNSRFSSIIEATSGIRFPNNNTTITNVSNTLTLFSQNVVTSDIHISPFRQVNINNAGSYTAQASSILQVDSTTKGFLPPRMSNTQMLAIATPATGLMVYDTTNNKLCCYDGTTWQNLF